VLNLNNINKKAYVLQQITEQAKDGMHLAPSLSDSVCDS
jgi:hypothetical protein